MSDVVPFIEAPRSSEAPSMAPVKKERATNGHPTTITLTVKFSKEVADIVKQELERLHNLLMKAEDRDWAKSRIEKIHKGLLSPDPKILTEALTGESDDE